jgi:hypothetical protein
MTKALPHWSKVMVLDTCHSLKSKDRKPALADWNGSLNLTWVRFSQDDQLLCQNFASGMHASSCPHATISKVDDMIL